MKPGLAHGEELTYSIIGLAMRVHRRLGPGLLESVYQRCLCHELTQAEIPFEYHVPLPIRYDGIQLQNGYIADIIVRNEVILELKSVDHVTPLHQAVIDLSSHQRLPHRSFDQLQHGVVDRRHPPLRTLATCPLGPLFEKTAIRLTTDARPPHTPGNQPGTDP